MAEAAAEVKNIRVVLREYMEGFPKESNMEVVTTGTAKLCVPEGSTAVLLKNLYLSCDPYMRNVMSKPGRPGYVPSAAPGSDYFSSSSHGPDEDDDHDDPIS